MPVVDRSLRKPSSVKVSSSKVLQMILVSELLIGLIDAKHN